MAIGAWLMLSENHDHHHIHEPAEHIPPMHTQMNTMTTRIWQVRR
jgi:hypothetical protein